MVKIPDRLEKATRDNQVVAQKTLDSDIDPRIMAYYAPQSPVAEQYRIIRTNITAGSREIPLKSLAVTSSTHGEGKTITAINLAVTMARDRDKKRVLLADGDLRRANVLKYLGMAESTGITDIIVKGLDPELGLRETGIEGLTVLGAGSKSPDPAELLASRAFVTLLDSLKERFDFIIFDAPPVIPVTDGGLVAARCDGTLVVVQAGRTQRGIVRHCSGLLQQAQARVLGYVVTNIRYHIPAYIYRYL